MVRVAMRFRRSTSMESQDLLSCPADRLNHFTSQYKQFVVCGVWILLFRVKYIKYNNVFVNEHMNQIAQQKA